MYSVVDSHITWHSIMCCNKDCVDQNGCWCKRNTCNMWIGGAQHKSVRPISSIVWVLKAFLSDCASLKGHFLASNPAIWLADQLLPFPCFMATSQWSHFQQNCRLMETGKANGKRSRILDCCCRFVNGHSFSMSVQRRSKNLSLYLQ